MAAVLASCPHRQHEVLTSLPGLAACCGGNVRKPLREPEHWSVPEFLKAILLSMVGPAHRLLLQFC